MFLSVHRSDAIITKSGGTNQLPVCCDRGTTGMTHPSPSPDFQSG